MSQAEYVCTLELRVKGLERLVRQGLNCTPVASEIVKPNVNRVDYTDRRWAEVVAFTKKANDYLHRGGTL